MNVSPFLKQLSVSFDTSTHILTDESCTQLATELGMQIVEFDAPITITITYSSNTYTATINKYFCFPGTEEGFYIYKNPYSSSSSYNKRLAIVPVMSKESVPVEQAFTLTEVFPYDNMSSSSSCTFHLYRFANDEIAITSSETGSSSTPYIFVATYGKNNNVSSRAFLTLYPHTLYEMRIGDTIVRGTRTGISGFSDSELTNATVLLLKIDNPSLGISFDKVYTGILGSIFPSTDSVFTLNGKTYIMLRKSSTYLTCVIEYPGEVT